MKKETGSALNTSSLAARSKSEPLPIQQSVSKRTDPGAARRSMVPSNGGNGHEESSRQLNAEQVLAALMALRQGDFLARLPVGWTGIAGKVAATFNEVAEL